MERHTSLFISSLKVPLGNANKISRLNEEGGRQGIFLPHLLSGVADENSCSTGPIGKAARRRNRSQHINAARIRILAWCRHFAKDVKWPIGNHGHGYFGVLKVFTVA